MLAVSTTSGDGILLFSNGFSVIWEVSSDCALVGFDISECCAVGDVGLGCSDCFSVDICDGGDCAVDGIKACFGGCLLASAVSEVFAVLGNISWSVEEACVGISVMASSETLERQISQAL